MDEAELRGSWEGSLELKEDVELLEAKLRLEEERDVARMEAIYARFKENAVVLNENLIPEPETGTKGNLLLCFSKGPSEDTEEMVGGNGVALEDEKGEEGVPVDQLKETGQLSTSSSSPPSSPEVKPTRSRGSKRAPASKRSKKKVRGDYQYHCSECNKKFVAKWYLADHTNVVHKGILFDCKDCNQKFRQRVDFNSHKRTAHGGIPERKLEPKSSTSGHVSASAPDSGVKTMRSRDSKRTAALKSSKQKNETCSGPTSSGPKKKTASKRSKKVIRPGHQCTRCEKVFAYLNYLKDHERVEHDKIPFRCKVEECGAEFKARSHLSDHMKIHRPSRIIPRKDGRPMIFDKTCVVDGKVVYDCKQCDKRFQNKSTLQYHLRRDHGMEGFTCEDCGRSFGRRLMMTRHRCPARKKKSNGKKNAPLSSPPKPLEDVKSDSPPPLPEFMAILGCDVRQKCHEESKEEEETPEDATSIDLSMNNVREDANSNVEEANKAFMKGDLNDQEKIDYEWIPFMCESCGGMFESRAELCKHVWAEHDGMVGEN